MIAPTDSVGAFCIWRPLKWRSYKTVRFAHSLAALLVFCSAAPASAQTGALTLEDCVRLALKAPSAVTIAQQERRISEYGISAARASFLPQIQLNNGFNYNSSPLAGNPDIIKGGSFVALNGIREYQSLIGSALEIDTSGRLRAALARARADQQIAAADLAIIQRDLKRAVTAAFYQLVLARRLIAANREVLKEAESFAERSRTMYREGEVAQADVTKAESQIAFLTQAVQAAELDAQTANAALASFWTEDVAAELNVTDNLESQPAPETAESKPSAFLGRPEFRVLDAQRQGFEADYRHQRDYLFPQLTFNLEYGIDSDHVAIRDRGQAYLFTLNIPIFDWFKTRDEARQFRLRAEQTETRKEISRREFSRDYQNALSRVRLIHGQIALTETQVRSSEENLKLSRIRYEGGEGPSLDVVAAQTQLAQARSNYYTALAAYAMARADLEVASGK